MGASSFSVSATKCKVAPIELAEDGVLLLDQTALPREVRYSKVETADEMRHAIRTMIIRGAPAIGIAGAYGMVLSARKHLKQFNSEPENFTAALMKDAELLESARPTAVNLGWAINRMRKLVAELGKKSPELISQRIKEEAIAIYEEDLERCKTIGRLGATLVPKGAHILTHCNAGALATAGYGTALGIVRAAFEKDPSIKVFVNETRPRLQGARLTTWELLQEGIDVTLITDSMSAWVMKQGKIDLIIVGADRIAGNGDTANKIGTYLLAIAAKAHDIPFYVAAPSSTVDQSISSGANIPIEERPDDEIYWIHDESICPAEVNFYNPAFDVTPAELITAIITEKEISHYPYLNSL